jgi:hypothetical protein
MKYIKKFKIKVGIEEYPVNENDIERIMRAMQTNEIVKLDIGVIRGQAILAILQEQIPVSEPKDLSPSEQREQLLLEARKNCQECKGDGYIKIQKDGQVKIFECKCQKINTLALAH